MQSEEEALLARQQSGAHASTTDADGAAEHELQTADTLPISGSLVQVWLQSGPASVTTSHPPPSSQQGCKAVICVITLPTMQLHQLLMAQLRIPARVHTVFKEMSLVSSGCIVC